MNSMLLWIILLFSILIIFHMINLAPYRGWKRFHSSFSYDDYYRAINKLNEAGITYRSKTISNQRNSPAFYDHHSQIEIYVKEEDYHAAEKAFTRKI